LTVTPVNPKVAFIFGSVDSAILTPLCWAQICALHSYPPQLRYRQLFLGQESSKHATRGWFERRKCWENRAYNAEQSNITK
jgi:hypothetical protein